MYKLLLRFSVAVFVITLLQSCSMFRPKYGCKTNGRSLGAEKLMGGNEEAERAFKKAKKFKN